MGLDALRAIATQGIYGAIGGLCFRISPLQMGCFAAVSEIFSRIGNEGAEFLRRKVMSSEVTQICLGYAAEIAPLALLRAMSSFSTAMACAGIRSLSSQILELPAALYGFYSQPKAKNEQESFPTTYNSQNLYKATVLPLTLTAIFLYSTRMLKLSIPGRMIPLTIIASVVYRLAYNAISSHIHIDYDYPDSSNFEDSRHNTHIIASSLSHLIFVGGLWAGGSSLGAIAFLSGLRDLSFKTSELASLLFLYFLSTVQRSDRSPPPDQLPFQRVQEFGDRSERESEPEDFLPHQLYPYRPRSFPANSAPLPEPKSGQEHQSLVVPVQLPSQSPIQEFLAAASQELEMKDCLLLDLLEKLLDQATSLLEKPAENKDAIAEIAICVAFGC